jgi:hypothetical protein
MTERLRRNQKIVPLRTLAGVQTVLSNFLYVKHRKPTSGLRTLRARNVNAHGLPNNVRSRFTQPMVLLSQLAYLICSAEAFLSEVAHSVYPTS